MIESLRIVLVETIGALNLGSVARVMQNMGLSDLVLVNPQCCPDDPQAQQMAVHAQDILAGAKIVPDLLSAVQDCDRIIATVGRRSDRPVLSLEQGCQWLAVGGIKPAVVFGREDRGLSNWELQYFPEVLTIDTAPNSPSLNLAQAVAIVCYQWRSLQQAQTDSPTQSAKLALATTAELEAAFAELRELLLQIGYLYPHTAFARMQKLRQIFQRSQLSPAEVNMLRGILHQMRWSLSNGIVQRERSGI